MGGTRDPTTVIITHRSPGLMVGWELLNTRPLPEALNPRKKNLDGPRTYRA